MFAQIAPAFLEEVLIFLVPIFMAGARGSIAAARQAALATLAAHQPDTEQELRLAAQITQYGFSILESLAQATNPDLPLNTVLRLRGNANAMQRSANQCQRVLDRLQRERHAHATPPSVQPLSVEPAESGSQASPPPPVAPLCPSDTAPSAVPILFADEAKPLNGCPRSIASKPRNHHTQGVLADLPGTMPSLPVAGLPVAGLPVVGLLDSDAARHIDTQRQSALRPAA